MEQNKTIVLLERIASALERIAYTLDERPNDTDSELSNDDSIKSIENHAIVEDVQEKDRLNAIEDILNNRGISIKTIHTEDPSDEVINFLSEFLGKNYDGLRELLAKNKKKYAERRLYHAFH